MWLPGFQRTHGPAIEERWVMQRSSATCRPLRYSTPRASETSGVEDDVDRVMMVMMMMMMMLMMMMMIHHKWSTINDTWCFTRRKLRYMNIVKQEAVNNHPNSICSVWSHDMSGQMMKHESYPGINPLYLERKYQKGVYRKPSSWWWRLHPKNGGVW